MSRFWIAAFIFAMASSATAGSIVNDQFSGTQLLQPVGGQLFRSKVSVQGERIRIETVVDSSPSAHAQIMLLRLDQKAIYFLEPSAKTGMRADLTHPLPMLAPGSLTLAVLFQKEVAGSVLAWNRLEDEHIEGGVYEKYRVRGLPGMEAIVYLVPSTRLPFRVDLQLEGQTIRANWVDVVQGPQREGLFVIPQDFQIEDVPKDLR